jgi:hypothetical protein
MKSNNKTTQKARLRKKKPCMARPRVPNLRDPRVRAAILREAVLLSQHPENAAIDDWLDASRAWRD